MPRLLIVHHTPSPALQEMFEAAVSGARTDEIEGVEVVIRPALTAAAADVLQADGLLLGTPANIGYMSGALKHFFDGIYYPCLEATRRRPYGLYVHGGMDTGGAVRAVESITTGLQWRAVRPPVCVTGPPGKKDLEACWELGALLAAEIAGPLGTAGLESVPWYCYGAAPNASALRARVTHGHVVEVLLAVGTDHRHPASEADGSPPCLVRHAGAIAAQPPFAMVTRYVSDP